MTYLVDFPKMYLQRELEDFILFVQDDLIFQ